MSDLRNAFITEETYRKFYAPKRRRRRRWRKDKEMTTLIDVKKQEEDAPLWFKFLVLAFVLSPILIPMSLCGAFDSPQPCHNGAFIVGHPANVRVIGIRRLGIR